MQLAIASPKLQVLQKLWIMHQVQHVIHVEIVDFSLDQHVVHQGFQAGFFAGHVVVAVAGVDFLVLVVVHDGRGNAVAGGKVGDLVGFWVLYDVGVDHAFAGKQPVLELGFGWERGWTNSYLKYSEFGKSAHN